MSSYHSEAVAYYLSKAREAIREASAEIHKHEVPKAQPPEPKPKPATSTKGTERVAPVRAALAAARADTEETQ